MSLLPMPWDEEHTEPYGPDCQSSSIANYLTDFRICCHNYWVNDPDLQAEFDGMTSDCYCSHCPLYGPWDERPADYCDNPDWPHEGC
jgi:hypothetical protein